MPQPKYTVIGTPFSTFTRTITLALHYKSIPHTQVPVFPHSPGADAAHPFGIIPTLLIQSHSDADAGDGDAHAENAHTIKLRETQAIIRYIDRIAHEPTLHFHPAPAQPEDADADAGMIEEKMWEYVSFVASYGMSYLVSPRFAFRRPHFLPSFLPSLPSHPTGFPTIEHGLVKPRLKHLASGLSPSAITPLLTPNLPALANFLDITAQCLPSPPSHPTPPFLFAPHPTYADFHLFPILADLRPTPEWAALLAHPLGPRLERWMESMDALECVRRTREGTVSAGVGLEVAGGKAAAGGA
ncbi:hypothetical protein CVT25_004471 [Psilocybe cyanescens]|uniref:GST N-terminal domain-containing protein n=1 Tax=Psilocybe cyanescens TaxID=93625 RepID=A0A409X2H8_PSICY|nr:hypothetical protein CVT25_004471 [Psilocybe cyanescens]